ncbi:MAG: hypothetical protein ACKO7Z_09735 [Cyanobacteriota bacterium]
MDRFKPTRQPSNRFLGPAELAHRGTVRPDRGHPHGGGGDLFPEGQWRAIRVQLEREGWNPSQIDLLHDQLRQGWPLTLAKQNAARLSGHCPIRSRTGP